MLPYGTLQFISPHFILSYHLCFGPHGIISRYAFTMKQTTNNDFRKRAKYTKINLNNQGIFENFFKFLFVLEQSLK